MPVDKEHRAWLYGLAAMLAWSSMATAFKLTLQWLSPFAMVALAGFVSWASLALLAVFLNLWPKLWRLRPRVWGMAAVLGLANPVSYYPIVFSAYAALPAQLAQLVNFTWPIVLALLTALLARQRLRLPQLGALGLGYLGVAIAVLGNEGVVSGEVSLHGILLALCSTGIWALYWLYYARSGVHGTLLLLASFTTALPWLVLLWWLSGFALPPWQGLVGVAYIGLFEMGIIFVLWGRALQLTRYAGQLAQLVFLAPFLSLLWIQLVLAEDVVPVTAAGMILVFAGIMLHRRPS